MSISSILNIELQNTLEFLTGPTFGSLEKGMLDEVIDAKELGLLMGKKGYGLIGCRIGLIILHKLCKYFTKDDDDLISKNKHTILRVIDPECVLTNIIKHKHENLKLALELLEDFRDLMTSTNLWNVNMMRKLPDDKWNPLLGEIELLKIALMFS